MQKHSMPSLFDANLLSWRADPEEAFKAFVQSPAFVELGRRRPERDETGLSPALLRKGSLKVYYAMFGKFIAWTNIHQKHVLDLSSEDIMVFLEQGRVIDGVLRRDLNSLIRVRYLRLLERVYAYLEVAPNPARHAAFDIFQSAHKTGQDKGKVVLSEADHVNFMRALPGELRDPLSASDNADGWKRRRDRAMQALMIGAGLKVSEVVGLRPEQVHAKDSNGSMPVSIAPSGIGSVLRAHQTQCRPFAVAEVLAWVAERHALKIPGPLLFPATLQGGRLDHSTVYRQVKATLKRAGIAAERQGGRTLRNSFGARELEVNSVELVGEFLGHRRIKSTRAYLKKKKVDKPS